MKVLLMHRDRDFDLQQELPPHEQVLRPDLELDTLFRAMSGGDDFLLDVARRAVLSGLRNDVEAIRYRQAIVEDGLENPAVVREMYAVAVEALEKKRRTFFGIFSNYPSAILSGSIEVLQIFVDELKKLRGIARSHAARFRSEGFTTLFAMLERELSDEYFARIEGHLRDLRFRHGVLIGAELGDGNQGTNHVLRKPNDDTRSWLERLFSRGPPGFTFRIPDRDESGHKALAELRDRGITLVANALAQSTEHILSFFTMLRTELAFYVGCVNLREQLAARGEPVCFPRPEPVGARQLRFEELYDVCLALSMDRKVVGNALDLDGKSLVVVTGANQGGKSTFLRSVGLAQLMMQAGMFVGAESFRAELCTALFTHYKREEDPTMKSGKLDEELGRMSDIADHAVQNSMALFNESFAATNEREGSEIARQIVRALLEKGIKVVFVTHLYEFAHGFFARNKGDAMFLRAERKQDGTRTFRVIEGEPRETSHGQDVYKEVFESAAAGDGSGRSARCDGVARSVEGTDPREGSHRMAKIPEEAASEERKR